MTIIKIVFVILLCIPIASISFVLFEKLLDEYIRVHKRGNKEKGRVEHIEEYRQRNRRYH
ncbi:MAG: hypothetical protein VB095_13685 [Anaerovorax sp.]|nr:hypothetical protein [Anaerovorax sp.]